MHIRDVFVTLSREQEISAEREKEMWGIAERMKEKNGQILKVLNGLEFVCVCTCFSLNPGVI